MVILKDISDLIQGEYLKTAEKMTDIMIASTSHDMRTPLNSITHMHKMIESRTTDLTVLKWLKVAHSSTHLLLFLVNDTLDFY